MEKNAGIGVLCAVVSTIAFGSTYVPLKWFHKSDGLYFQLVQSIGLLTVGICWSLVDIVVGTGQLPLVHPIAMLSGVFFSIGNSLTIFIMNGVGLAIGYLLWNTMTCVTGWAVTRFGLFMNPQQLPQTDWLNILGVITVCIGGAIYAPIKHYPTAVRPAPWSFESAEKLAKEEKHQVTLGRRVLCLFLTMFVGFLYGNFLTPIMYVIHNEAGARPDVQSYFLSYTMGSYFASVIIFVIYALAKKNVPLINPELSVPSIVSGIFYGIAVATFFMANQHLDQVIAYPILSKAPGIVVSLWAIFLFKEIRGRRDIIQLYIGIFVTIVGIAFISISKVKF